MAQGLLCFLSLIKTLMYIYIYIFLEYNFFSNVFFSKEKSNRWKKKRDGEKEEKENETLWIVRSLFAMKDKKKGREEGGGSGQETDTVILINGVCRVINVCPCVHWPAIFLRMRGNSESTGISGLPFCLLIYLRGCKVSFLFEIYVFFFFFFHHVSFFLNPSQFSMI